MLSIILTCIYFPKEVKDLTLISLLMNLPIIFMITKLTAQFINVSEVK